MKSEVFLKNIKNKKGILIFGIVCIIIFSMLLLAFIGAYSNAKKNPKQLAKASSKDEYVKLDVAYIYGYFAEADKSKEKAYLLFDKDMNSYVGVINKENLKKLDALLEYGVNEEAEYPGIVTIYGTTTEIPDTLVKLAIEYYNKLYDEEKANSVNWKTHIKEFYIDTNGTVLKAEGYLLYGGIVFGIIGVIFTGIYLNRKRNTKKSYEKYGAEFDKIIKEIDNDKTYYNPNGKIYLTDNYVISYANGLVILEYKDIAWIYPHELRQNGVVNKNINVYTKAAKLYQLCFTRGNKKNNELFDETYNLLQEKTPKALQGFTKENQEKAKEIYAKEK